MQNNLQFNPLNIRSSNQKFIGEVPSQNAFKAFQSFPYGLRAAGKILLTYYRIDHLNTINGIVSRWAPSSEDDTEAYKKFVSDFTGIGIYEAFKVNDANEMKLLLDAMGHRENPVQYTGDDLAEGVKMALV